jgi:hypothetical protein
MLLGDHSEVQRAVGISVHIAVTGRMPDSSSLYTEDMAKLDLTAGLPNKPNIVAIFWLLFALGQPYDKV